MIPTELPHRGVYNGVHMAVVRGTSASTVLEQLSIRNLIRKSAVGDVYVFLTFSYPSHVKHLLLRAFGGRLLARNTLKTRCLS